MDENSNNNDNDNAPLPPRVKIIEVCKVAPPPELEIAAPTSLPLTFFDLLWLRFPRSQIIFFYELPSGVDISFVDAIVPKLKSSLSLTLRHYLPLAGNLVWPQHSEIPTVEFVDGDGVSLTVAHSDHTHFNHLSSNGFRQVSEFHPLFPHLPASHVRAAVMAIQVTRFENRGFCIGITCQHAIMDGKTGALFMKLWAEICIGESKGVPLPTTKLMMPNYERSVIDDPKGLAKIYANTWLNNEGPNNRSLINLKFPKTQPGLIQSSFEFTHQNIQKLRQWILKKKKKKNDGDESEYISSFALTTAYLCVCTAKLEGLKDGKLWFRFLADARSRLKPPLPSSYFGNCLLFCGVCFERSELLGESGIVLAAEEISKVIKSLEERDNFEGAEQWGKIISEVTNNYSKADGVSIAWSPKFEVYSADFGWGKPRKVEIVSNSCSFVLTESTNSDVGMEIGVIKNNRDEMECFAAIFHQGFHCL